jgi:hypothetical protein
MVSVGGTYIIQIPSWTIRSRSQIVADVRGTCGNHALAESDLRNIGTVYRILKQCGFADFKGAKYSFK